MSRGRHGRVSGGRPASRGTGPLASLVLAVFLILGLVFGGTSRTGAWPLLLPAALALLLFLVLRLRWRATVYADPLLGLFVVGLVLLPLIQLVPLPPAFWTSLPGRDAVTAGFAGLATPAPWMPLSLDPGATFAFLLALAPPACIILLVARMRAASGAVVAATILVMAFVSLLLGLMQVQQGAQSALYFHEYSNRDSAVGFFANANHLATLLLLSLPLSAALLAAAPPRHPAVRFRYAVFAVHILLVATGIFLTRSVAGLLLLAPAALASAALLAARRRIRRLAAIGLALAVPALALAFYTGPGFATSLGSSPLDRLGMARTTLAATADTFPVGVGVGAFPAAYRLHEDLADVTPTFVNHAHNDYLELLLEAGLAGLLLVALFLAWAARRTLAAWRTSGPAVWPRAATIILWIILLHSLVDYPVRTPAIAMLLAWAAGLIALGEIRQEEPA